MVLALSRSQKLITASGPLWPRLSKPPPFSLAYTVGSWYLPVCFLGNGTSLVNAAARNARIPRVLKTPQICNYLREESTVQKLAPQRGAIIL